MSSGTAHTAVTHCGLVLEGFVCTVIDWCKSTLSVHAYCQSDVVWISCAAVNHCELVLKRFFYACVYANSRSGSLIDGGQCRMVIGEESL